MASLGPASLSVGLSYFTALFHEAVHSCAFSFQCSPLSPDFSVSVIDMQQCVPGLRLCAHGRPLKQLGADSRVHNSCKHAGGQQKCGSRCRQESETDRREIPVLPVLPVLGAAPLPVPQTLLVAVMARCPCWTR
ncbi:hypothetical protein R3I93_001306 [Phoxinus phoxinus]|uniref:Uncharacterized protein n=1 Tax=Phoxinus phoxinus TaxID=58324 RepID=A0AAN9DGU3_9TELE